ncbi:hypothetical protein MSSAC_2831 [Methanosarcina siciliae C2J]|uniref:Uncharacterized protein n=2 Tax=Methanosarcina siciliae TaxID=38027 RepID=A0A0E3P675_9EURY|nr:hypothetical protein [Methanosarcina siciliae]AKB29250.1 hypothetical protein MSSIT_2531 [Methanosarcina siciliae T4/M]AKB37421.1 hypothetical protein MSSAC_2831 [Methanosarcina siciliae C2J]
MEIQHSDSGEDNFGKILGLREEIGKIQASIADYETGKKLNIAIVAGTLAGKTALLGEIERINRNRAAGIILSEIVRNRKEISIPDDTKRVMLYDNCHYLYMRKPGGFDIFYEFLDMISSQEKLFVTTWNLYSWRYLSEAFGIERYFPVQIFIPAFEKENLRLFILKRYGKAEIRFENDEESKKEPFIYMEKYPLELSSLGRKIFVPVLKINLPYLRQRFLHEEETQTAEERVFEKIYLESKGNPGIAWRIWELGLDYPGIKYEDIGQFSFDIDLEHEEAFVLSLILSYQALKRTEIAEIIGSEFRADKVLFRLLTGELIFKDEGASYRVRPEALQSVIAYMEKLRLVW